MTAPDQSLRENAARIIACHLTSAPDTVCIPISMTAGDLRTVYAALSSPPDAAPDHVGEATHMMPDEAELRRLAEAATPGPWYRGHNENGLAQGEMSVWPDAKMIGAKILATGHHAPWDGWFEQPAKDAAFIAAANPAAVLELLSEIEGLKAERDRLKLAICGGEDAPGAINAVSVEDCERFITEERGRHIDTEAGLEYVRASRDGAAGRAHDLYMALAEVKEQVVTYPLSDNSTCMCGAPLGGHNVGSGHAPVSLADHAISLIVEAIDKALRFGAPTDGRPDDYEGPDVGMHDTEISERDDD